MKTAYHRALLLYHPDKAQNRSYPDISSQFIDGDAGTSRNGHQIPSVDEIQKAYVTLSDPILRAAFDASMSEIPVITEKGAQRPAEIVSLEEFTPDAEGSDTLTHPCRCGASYRITEEQLDADVHLIGCNGCSEVVWVGYEAVEE